MPRQDLAAACRFPTWVAGGTGLGAQGTIWDTCGLPKAVACVCGRVVGDGVELDARSSGSGGQVGRGISSALSASLSRFLHRAASPVTSPLNSVSQRRPKRAFNLCLGFRLSCCHQMTDEIPAVLGTHWVLPVLSFFPAPWRNV